MVRRFLDLPDRFRPVVRRSGGALLWSVTAMSEREDGLRATGARRHSRRFVVCFQHDCSHAARSSNVIAFPIVIARKLRNEPKLGQFAKNRRVRTRRIPFPATARR